MYVTVRAVQDLMQWRALVVPHELRTAQTRVRNLAHNSNFELVAPSGSSCFPNNSLGSLAAIATARLSSLPALVMGREVGFLCYIFPNLSRFQLFFKCKAIDFIQHDKISWLPFFVLPIFRSRDSFRFHLWRNGRSQKARLAKWRSGMTIPLLRRGIQTWKRHTFSLSKKD